MDTGLVGHLCVDGLASIVEIFLNRVEGQVSRQKESASTVCCLVLPSTHSLRVEYCPGETVTLKHSSK